MEPGHEDREYDDDIRELVDELAASMEPGHEDREYQAARADAIRIHEPQWSPVMKTGNTVRQECLAAALAEASMEPGHEDREYWYAPIIYVRCGGGLNGARS